MNPERSRVDLKAALRDAATVAEKQERHGQEALLGRLTLKAASDAEFLRELRSDPQAVVQREAEGLQVPVTKSVTEIAGKLFNNALPGFDIAKVQELVLTTIDDVRQSFKLTLQLSRWLFFAGLSLVVVAVLAALIWKSPWATGVSGGSGALSLLLSAVMNPLNRIQNAAGNLAQIQMAYLAFYKRLYILGNSEKMATDDAVRYSEAIGLAASSMVESIGTALDKTRIEPSEGNKPHSPRSRIPKTNPKAQAEANASASTATE